MGIKSILRKIYAMGVYASVVCIFVLPRGQNKLRNSKLKSDNSGLLRSARNDVARPIRPKSHIANRKLQSNVHFLHIANSDKPVIDNRRQGDSRSLRSAEKRFLISLRSIRNDNNSRGSAAETRAALWAPPLFPPFPSSAYRHSDRREESLTSHIAHRTSQLTI